MKISNDIKLGFDNVMIVPRRSNIQSRSEVILEKRFYFYHSPRILNCIPIFCANMASIAGHSMAAELYKYDLLTCLHKYLSIEDINATLMRTNLSHAFMSIGINDFNKLESFLNKFQYQPNICIDVPNGYMDIFIEYCAQVRKLCPESIIMAGNVVTPEAVQELIVYGKVDIVKLGIGPGKNCITSKVTGVGYPQLSCAYECTTVAHGLKSADKHLGLVCLDGGFKEIGDFAKGFCAGADFCMSGSFFAGADECCGEWENNKKTLNYDLIHYGMSSHYAQNKHENKQKKYRASEGIICKVPNKGPVCNIVQEILGGLRSTGAYIGADCIKDFNKCGSFIRI